MSARLPKGILNIAIELELDPNDVGLSQQRSLGEVTGRLLNLLAKYEIPATCAVADPAVSAATDRITGMQAGHEVAILGDSSWAGREAGRSRFSRELARRAVRGRTAGLSISTLVCQGVELDADADLALKHGIVAVRHAQTGKANRPFQPHTLRFGLWSFPLSHRLPGTSRWLPGGGGGYRARGGIDRAITERGLYQLSIDAAALAAHGYTAQRAIERVLQHAEKRRRQGVLEIATIGDTAAYLSRQNQSRPSHSILRPAA